MLCPVCNVTLHKTRQQEVEIDYCTQCRGVWLDRGELDRIIQRVMALAMPFPASPQSYELPLTHNSELASISRS
jgi:hypothetical protein